MIGEGERIPGTGVRVGHEPLRRETVIIVTDDELATNPLVAAWVEALANAAKQARTDVEFMRKQKTEQSAAIAISQRHYQAQHGQYRKLKDAPQA